MGSYRTRSGSFSKNLYHNLNEINRPAPVIDLNHDANDDLYWKVWIITDARPKLAELVDAVQLADYLREISPLPQYQQYLKITAQIALEEAHKLADSTCTCWELPDGRGSVCPVCQAMADGIELPY